MDKIGASYQYTITVSKEQIDNLHHVNNVVYVKWINDISEKHWQQLSSIDIDSKYFWVVLRHEVDYLGQAKMGDELTIKTNVGESSGAKSIRFVEIFKNDKLIVKGKTTWCLMDKSTQKPKRIDDDILNVLYYGS
ncbi:thioesterase family protein [Litoribaculum gwangyangense]|uniref:Thioesterase family protein n=1 Tax=Litoribaculum gwangyangense TaxID=1130722 RepID=A0ABP9CGB2_9FLAO